jgi:hypothetical protein
VWNCPQCGEEHGDYNAWCEFCKEDRNQTIYNPTPFFVRDIRYYWLSQGDKPMTPQEELFAKFFQKHTDIMLVKNMGILEIQKYIEDYSKVALEGKAAVYAGTQLLNENKKRSKHEPGFQPSVNATQTEAINIIRQKKLSKKELVEKQLKELYAKVEETTGQKVGAGAAAEAAKAVSARNMLSVVENKAKNESRFSFKKKNTAVDDALKAILNPESAKLLVDGKIVESKPATKTFGSWRKR